LSLELDQGIVKSALAQRLQFMTGIACRKFEAIILFKKRDLRLKT